MMSEAGMNRAQMGFVIPGWSEGPDPESRDSGFALRAPRNDGFLFVNCCWDDQS
jgi:hypothetical protein